MNRVREKVRDRFGTVAGVRAYLEQQGWDLTHVPALDQKEFTASFARDWRKEREGRKARSLPMTDELFQLAVDAAHGPWPESRGLRFRASRLMTMRRTIDLGTVLRSQVKRKYKSYNSLMTTMKRIEGKSPLHDRDIAVALADAYDVKLEWLLGEVPAERGNYLRHLSERASRTDSPYWLVPWRQAVEAAVSVCLEVSNDLLLTDPMYAGEMLEVFFERRYEAISADRAQWGMLIYFPLAHAAMVLARERVMGSIPHWMLSTGPVARDHRSSRSARGKARTTTYKTEAGKVITVRG